MKILYVTYTDIADVTSGSSVRPACMYQAFLERGHDVYLLSGVCGRGYGKQRKAAVVKAMDWLKTNRPDLCYIESPTYPIMDKCDYDLIRLLKKKGIPSGYFYRDYYRMFPDLFPRRTGFVNTLKEWYLDFLQWRTDRVLHKVDIVYFSSRFDFAYFPYACMKTLPPAGEIRFLPPHENTKTCIYVGGVSEFYGYPLMMEAFRLLNAGEETYRLILVCRKAEYDAIKGEEALPSWLEVHHASGKELEPLYARADVGLLALQANPYSDLSIGIKLFQYLSYGLPVISTDVAAMRELIQTYKLGAIAPHDAQGFADTVRALLNDAAFPAAQRSAIEEAITNHHLWVHRVDQIVSDLTEK